MKRFTAIVLVLIVALCASAFARGGTEESGVETTESASAGSGAYNESSMLDARVRAGELPPVDERLPADPMRVQPYDRIGRYGGTIRIADNSVNGVWVGRRNGDEGLVAWDPKDPTNIIPNIASSWEVSSDGRTFIFFLRKGLKWSDGVPMTAHDVAYWWNDYEMNPDIKANPSSVWTAGGPPTVTAIDDTTVQFTFPKPHGLFLAMIAFRGVEMMNHPKHYMSQFNPRYTPLAEVEATTKNRGFENWKDLYAAELLNSNANRPRMMPWIIVDAEATLIRWERNPYYFKVDTEGNQLPYIDRMETPIISDKEIIALKLQTGELDFDAQRMTVADFPVLKGSPNLKLTTWSLPLGTIVHLNYTTENLVLREVFSDKRFREALSIGVDRSDIIENQFLGIGEAVNILPADPYGIPELDDDYTEYDPKRANQLLDEMGLDERDADGFRIGPDDKRLTFILGIAPGIGSREPAVFEIITEYWRNQLGLYVRTRLEDGGIWRNRQIQNEQDAIGYSMARYQWVLAPNALIPVFNGGWTAPLWGAWYASGGTQGIEPTGDVRQMQILYDELKSTADLEEQASIGDQILRLVHKNLYSIAYVTSRAVVAMNVKLQNVAGEEAIMDWRLMSPKYLQPEQWYYAE